MVVKVESRDDVCILHLEGRFATGQDAAYLRDQTDSLQKQGYRKIVANFTDVAYIDSTGIGFLIAIYTSILNGENRGKFVLAGPNHRVREVLTLTKLDTVLPSYENVSAALAALGGECQ